MSKQLALSAAFSILMMAVYVLFGADAAHAPLALDSPAMAGAVEVSAPELPEVGALLPLVR